MLSESLASDFIYMSQVRKCLSSAEIMRHCSPGNVWGPLSPEGHQELKSLLMKVKEESEKVELKLNSIQKTKIIASGPIT